MLWPDLGIGQNDRAEFSEIQNKIRNAPRDVSWVADSGLNRVRAKARDIEDSRSLVRVRGSIRLHQKKTGRQSFIILDQTTHLRELIITDLEAEILAAESIHPCTHGLFPAEPIRQARREEHAPASERARGRASDGFEKSALEKTPETKWEK